MLSAGNALSCLLFGLSEHGLGNVTAASMTFGIGFAQFTAVVQQVQQGIKNQFNEKFLRQAKH